MSSINCSFAAVSHGAYDDLLVSEKKSCVILIKLNQNSGKLYTECDCDLLIVVGVAVNLSRMLAE